MARPLCAFLLALVLVPSASAADPLPGEYTNVTNGRVCTVVRRGDTYIFRNENGSRALFAFVGPNRLGIVSTRDWDPNVVATIGRDRLGRLTIRFDAPFTPSGAWVAALR